ncbi:MAG: hypothetical protein NT154_28440 [Verrucomicrobia bacterium]|nr:hypothetical protein [Verrucomicrobiota bacterium]
MNTSGQRFDRVGFSTPEGLVALGVLSIIAVVVLSTARKLDFSFIQAIGLLIGGIALFWVWLKRRSIIDGILHRNGKEGDDDI